MSDNFFVCLFLNEGRLAAIQTSLDGDFSQPETLTNENPSELSSDFSSLFADFGDTILGYIDMLPLVAQVGHSFMRSLNFSNVKAVLSTLGSIDTEVDDKIIYKIPQREYSRWTSYQSGRRTSNIVGKQIPKMLLIGVVSALEHHQAMAVSECLKIRPGKYLPADKMVPLSDIESSGSIDELKKRLRDKSVDQIMRESFSDQLDHIQRICDIGSPIKDSFEGWGDLVEVFERRNLFAHANGIVNEIYIRNTSLLKTKNNEFKIGEELFVSAKYFSSSLEVVAEFGVNLIQVMWRKVAPQETEEADDQLGSLGYDLLERGEYRLASRVLKIASSMRGKKNEWRRRADIVNLANAYRLMGDAKTAGEILDTEDWSVLDHVFRVCVAAVRGDIPTVTQMLEKWPEGDENLGEHEFESWPVFFSVRDEQQFMESFRNRFGRDYNPAPKIRNRIMDAMNEARNTIEAASKNLGDKDVVDLDRRSIDGEKQVH